MQPYLEAIQTNRQKSAFTSWSDRPRRYSTRSLLVWSSIPTGHRGKEKLRPAVALFRNGC